MVLLNSSVENRLDGVNIIFVTTISYFMVNQLYGMIKFLLRSGASVTLVSSPGVEYEKVTDHPRLTVITMDIPRKLSPIRDLLALIKLYNLLRSQDFDIVHSATPKAGLLCAIAGIISHIKIRLHTYTGQPWVTRKGPMKHFMIVSDRLISMLNTHCYADSVSQKEFLIDKKVVSSNKISTYSHGSIAGVDIARFDIQKWSSSDIKRIRQSLNLDSSDFVVCYVGRITDEKGVNECLAAVDRAHKIYSDIKLLLVGPVDDESGQKILSSAQSREWVIHVDLSSRPEDYLSVSDIICLVSYREGFGTVLIEAGAMGVPAIASDIVGIRDAVEHGATGYLVPVKTVSPVCDKIIAFYEDRALLKTMSRNAMHRASSKFDSEYVYNKVANEYVGHLSPV